MKRIGLFGGSFDPVHQGHLVFAHSAVQALGLDEVLWVPTGQPWQKSRVLTPAHHRVAMLLAAIESEPRFLLERCEVERSGPSYTLETVQHLVRDRGPAQWFLLIGQDQYANFHTWHGWTTLLGLVTLAVAARDGQAPDAPALRGLPAHSVVVPMQAVPVSASGIRRRLAAGEPAAALAPALVAPAVASYIARHALYGVPPNNSPPA